MVAQRTDREPGRVGEEPILAPTEVIRGVLDRLNKGTSVHYLLSLFRDSAEIGRDVVRAALDRYRAETGRISDDSTTRTNANYFLPRHGLRIVINPVNRGWMVVLYDRPEEPIDFGAEVDALIEEIRSGLGLGESAETTCSIVFFLRQRLKAVREEFGRLES